MAKPDYVSPVPGSSIVYVIVGDRDKFDQINRPVTVHPPQPDGKHAMTKDIGNWSMLSNDGLVIFQHWVDLPSEADDHAAPAQIKTNQGQA